MTQDEKAAEEFLARKPKRIRASLKRGFLEGAAYKQKQILELLKSDSLIEVHNNGDGWAYWLEARLAEIEKEGKRDD